MPVRAAGVGGSCCRHKLSALWQRVMRWGYGDLIFEFPAFALVCCERQLNAVKIASFLPRPPPPGRKNCWKKKKWLKNYVFPLLNVKKVRFMWVSAGGVGFGDLRYLSRPSPRRENRWEKKKCLKKYIFSFMVLSLEWWMVGKVEIGRMGRCKAGKSFP